MYFKDKAYNSAYKFNNLLSAYVKEYIEKISEKYNLYKDNKSKFVQFCYKHGALDLHIRICKKILYKNLIKYYKSDEDIEYDITLTDEEYKEQLGSDMSFLSSMYKSNVEKTEKKNYENLLNLLCQDHIKKFKVLRQVANGTEKKIFIDFKFLLDTIHLFNFNKRDELYIILHYIKMNLENGILTRDDCDFIPENIKDSYRIINNYLFTEPITENKTYKIIDAIIKILGIKIDVRAYVTVLDTDIKDQIEKEKKKTAQKVIKAEKVYQPTQNKMNKEEYNILQRIKTYYDIDEKEFKRLLTIDEIKYVAYLLYKYGINETAIEDFIRTALRLHKTKNPLERFIDLTKKIEYFKEVGQIERINNILIEILDEFNNSRTKSDKKFWMKSFEEELLKLEKEFGNNYSYELSLIKNIT